jgi:hypothetical protein
MAEPWRLAGEFVVSCNCDWCPCAISLGRARPTHGHCLSWFAYQIAEGRWGDVELGGLNAALMLAVPGRMAEGDYTLGLFLDARGTDGQRQALEEILSGRAGGPPGWWSLVVTEYLGAQVVPIEYEAAGPRRRISIPKILDGSLARGTRSRVRGWGRSWDLSGASAEYARFRWEGP